MADSVFIPGLYRSYAVLVQYLNSNWDSLKNAKKRNFRLLKRYIVWQNVSTKMKHRWY